MDFTKKVDSAVSSYLELLVARPWIGVGAAAVTGLGVYFLVLAFLGG